MESQFGSEAGRLFAAAAQEPTEADFYASLSKLVVRYVFFPSWLFSPHITYNVLSVPPMMF